jgi:uncharacterized protein
VVAITWIKPVGAEYANVTLGAGQLHASGVAIGAEPVPYHLDYTLACDDGYLTRSLSVHAHGAGWSRDLLLNQDADGTWHIDAKAAGHGGVSWPGGNPDTFNGALDCDLGLSPLTNTMPVLRHGLLGGGEPVDFLMAWVSVPDLSVHANRQRYTFLRRAGHGAVINYSSGSFSADVTFDADGLVVDYPGLAARA